MVSGAWNAEKHRCYGCCWGKGRWQFGSSSWMNFHPYHHQFSPTPRQKGSHHHAMSACWDYKNISKYHSIIPLSLKDYYYSLFLSSIWKIFALRSGIKAKGAALISSSPDLSENMNGTPSAWRLLVTTSFERFLNLRSLAIFAFHSVSHLHNYDEYILIYRVSDQSSDDSNSRML